MANSSSPNHVREYSRNGKITLYVAQKDVVDHFRIIDPIEGFVLVPINKVNGLRLFVEIQLHFRHAAKTNKFINFPFKKTIEKIIVLDRKELFPLGNRTESPQLNECQTVFCNKIGRYTGCVCSFRLEFHKRTPPSLVMAGSFGATDDPYGLTYKIFAYLCKDPAFPTQEDSVKIDVRVIQETPPLFLLQRLPLVQVNPPTTRVLRRFLLSPGRMEIELSLNRIYFNYGEKLAVHIVINNNSNKTIRKIKCQLTQVSLFSLVGERRTPFFFLHSFDECPVHSGASIDKTYNMEAKTQSGRSQQNLIFEPSTSRSLQLEKRLSATTFFNYTHSKFEEFKISVSYEAEVKVYVGDGLPFDSMRSNFRKVSAHVPFVLFHQMARNDIDENQDGNELSVYQLKLLLSHMPTCRSMPNCRRTSLNPENCRNRLTRYLCMFCPQGFYFKRNMKQHVRTQHLKGRLVADMFRCNLCSSKVYSSSADLNRHMNEKHLTTTNNSAPMVVIPISALFTEVMVLSNTPPIKECRVLLERLPASITTTSVVKYNSISGMLEENAHQETVEEVWIPEHVDCGFSSCRPTQMEPNLLEYDTFANDLTSDEDNLQWFPEQIEKVAWRAEIACDPLEDCSKLDDSNDSGLVVY